MELEVYGALVVPIIIGIVQLAKNAGMNNKLAGIVALIIGMAVSFSYGLTEAQWTLFQCFIIGASLGLSASGLYSTQKNMRE